MNKLIVVLLILVALVSCFWSCKEEYKDSPANVQEVPNFLTHEECDLIIALSKEGLYDSTVYTEKADIVNTDHRQSKQKWLYDGEHSLIDKISKKVAQLTNTNIENQEPLQVVMYGKGGFFNPHYDACDDNPDICKRLDGDAGPRKITVLIYLNDNFTGGETAFPNLNYEAKPEKGKAIVFHGTDDNEQIIRDSLHGGNPVKDGEKWICNKWIRPRQYKVPIQQ